VAIAVAALSLVLKCLLPWDTLGTNDMLTSENFACVATERGANKHAGGKLISDWKCENGSRVVNPSVHERLTIQGMRGTTHTAIL
jgi:hypothetical protein